MSNSPSTTVSDAQPDRLARALPWLCLGLLVLPFHTLWIDFEQVRRGLLLLLTGAAMFLWPRLPHIRGERMVWMFLGGLVVCAIVQVAVQSAFHDDDTPWSFQPWEAAYRIAHWFALFVLMRMGAMMARGQLATAIASMVLATSLFGILQRLGLAEIGGYGVEREPVSTLGNLNVASEWTAIAGVAVAVLAKDIKQSLRWLPIAALAMAAAYLMVNPSRSGKVAMAAALILLAIMRRKQREFLPLLVAAGGALLGVLLTTAAPTPQLSDAAMKKELERGTVTLDVRFEIASGSTKLFGESLIFGQGPGQFAVEYPRVRSQKEIEASSHGRQFPTEVRTAHDDWLELLIDGGIVALVLFALMLFSLQRGTRDRTRLVPMFALLLLMLVRAPIGNAPAAAVAFLLIGNPVTVPAWTGMRRRVTTALAIAAGIALLWLGLKPVAGNNAFVPYLRAQRDHGAVPMDAIENSIWWMSYEPRWFEVEARNRMRSGDLQGAAHYAARALELRPFSPPLLVLLGEILSNGSRYGEAIAVAKQGLKIDAKNPELTILKSTSFAQLGDVDRAIEAVVIEPHQVVWDGLQTHFTSLGELAKKRNEPKQAMRFAIEAGFLGLAELFGSDATEALELMGQMNRKLYGWTKELNRSAIDTRYLVTAAIEALDRGRPTLATEYAEIYKLRGARLKPWQVKILGENIDRLRKVPGWEGL